MCGLRPVDVACIRDSLELRVKPALMHRHIYQGRVRTRWEVSRVGETRPVALETAYASGQVSSGGYVGTDGNQERDQCSLRSKLKLEGCDATRPSSVQCSSAPGAVANMFDYLVNLSHIQYAGTRHGQRNTR